MSFGLLEVDDSDANTILKNVIDTRGSICDIIAGDHEKHLHELIVSIKNTMSDLEPLNSLVNAKLKAVREELLPKLISNWHNFDEAERQAKDQLDGGKYRAPSENVLKSAKNVSAHNKDSESDFAILDSLIRTKPRSNTETLQCITMWSNNKTDVWLGSKSTEENNKNFENARRCSEKMKYKFKQRRHELLVRRKEILHQKQELKNITEEKKAVQKAEAVNKRLSFHVTAWLSVEEANEKIVDANKMVVVEAQLKFYENVMFSGNNGQCHKFFTKSKYSVKHTFSEMFKKLCNVIKFTISPCTSRYTNNESKKNLHKKMSIPKFLKDPN